MFRHKRRQWRHGVYHSVPIYFRRNIFEFFVSFLACTSGIVTFSTGIESEAIRTTLPLWLVFIWSVSLTIGPIFVIVGIVTQAKVFISKVPFWKRVEAFGLSNLAYVGYIYSIAIVLQSILAEKNYGSLPAVAFILAFALSCHYRVIEIHEEILEFKKDIGAHHERRNGD